MLLLEAFSIIAAVSFIIWFGGWIFANMRAAGIKRHYEEGTGDIVG